MARAPGTRRWANQVIKWTIDHYIATIGLVAMAILVVGVAIAVGVRRAIASGRLRAWGSGGRGGMGPLGLAALWRLFTRIGK